MLFPAKVRIKESGLRDGLQNVKVVLSTEQKIELLDEVIDAGIKIIDLGSFVRPDRVPGMADTPELVKYINAHPEKYEGVSFSCLVPNMRGLDRAIECGCKEVRCGVSASKMHALSNYNRLPEESIAAFESIFTKAMDHGMEIKGTVQMAFASPWEGEIPIETVIAIVEQYKNLNVHRVGISDTGSMANPRLVYERLSRLKDKFPDIEFGTHFHNARGLALPNMLAAMQTGQTVFDGCFAGLGGCPFEPGAAGNPSTEDVVNMFESMGIETGVDINKVMAISRKVEILVGQKAVSNVLQADTCENMVKKMAEKARKKAEAKASSVIK